MGSPIIEVGIGLLLVYLLMSVLVSQINNIIKNRLNVRGSIYRQELEDLLRDPVIQDKILSSPAIGLAVDSNQNDVIKRITAKRLTDVLIDVLVGNGETLERIEGMVNTPMVNDLLESVDSLELKKRLEHILATARDLGDAREKLWEWFDVGLGRASELYKRRLALFSVIVGALLAITLNVDTIYIGQTLWTDPILRATTAAVAVTTVEQMDVEAQTAMPDTFDEGLGDATGTVNTLLELRLPMGWYFEDVTGSPENSLVWGDTRNVWNLVPGNNPAWLTLLFSKIVGLIVTTIAVMQGAPFWFDLLRRATGK